MQVRLLLEPPFPMTGEIYDKPTRILVHSESDGESSYLVDLCAYPVEVAPDQRVCNGVCQCRDFIYRCEPKLKRPEHAGKIFRCKHLRWARENCFDTILLYLAGIDPNLSEKEQT